MDINRKRTGVEEKFFNICLQVVNENDLELYDLEYILGSSTLRLFVRDPKTNSAVIEDCVKVDRALTPYFEEDWVPDDIVLEVSSPGVYRNLKTLGHFNESVGEFVLITIHGSLSKDEIEGLPKGLHKQKKFRVKLKSIDNNNLKIDLDGFELEINFEQIKKACLDPDL